MGSEEKHVLSTHVWLRVLNETSSQMEHTRKAMNSDPL